VLGVFFVAALVFGLRYSQKQDAADAAAADLAAREAARETASAGRALAGAASSPPAGSASGSATSACPDGMVLIPRGEFFMGSDDDTEIEKPAHHVDLSPYCIDLYEVTTTRYVACSDAGKCKRAYRTNEWPEISAHDRDAYDPLCSVREPTMQADHPINCVDWEMASTFCRSLPGGRLPTEAEWEYAARGPDGRRYPWGDEPPGPTYLNACGSECVAWGKSVKAPMSAMYRGDDGWPTTSAVGSFPRGKSRFGLFDVAGNVWEWVADWQAPYGKTAVQDPKGPDSGKLKVVRGGAWNGALEGWVRPTFRFMNTPESRSFGIGFRCAATPR
jgi:formylglycine-generating enzyme required for sulfatase activity